MGAYDRWLEDDKGPIPGHTGHIPKTKPGVNMRVKTLEVVKQRLINLNENEEFSVEGHLDGSIKIIGKTGVVLLVVTSDMAKSLSSALAKISKKVSKQKEKQVNG